MTVTGILETTDREGARMGTMPRSLPLAAAALTLVGVPAGLALTGGNVQGVMTATLAFWLAMLMLLVGRWPLSVLITSVLFVVAMRTSGLVGSGWAWPATAAFAALALAGRLRAAVVVGSLTLGYGLVWEGVVEQKSSDWVLGHIGGGGLVLVPGRAPPLAHPTTPPLALGVAPRPQPP